MYASICLKFMLMAQNSMRVILSNLFYIEELFFTKTNPVRMYM